MIDTQTQPTIDRLLQLNPPLAITVETPGRVKQRHLTLKVRENLASHLLLSKPFLHIHMWSGDSTTGSDSIAFF